MCELSPVLFIELSPLEDIFLSPLNELISLRKLIFQPIETIDSIEAAILNIKFKFSKIKTSNF